MSQQRFKVRNKIRWLTGGVALGFSVLCMSAVADEDRDRDGFNGGHDRGIRLAADGFPASVPKAICGPRDHTESGLQGETTQQERFSGDSQTAYNCNLELVGEEPQDTFQGAYSQDGPAYYDVCAYYGTDRGATTGQGIKVIDVSDPRHPVVATQLTDTQAALAPHETLHSNARSRLLAMGQTTGPNFAVYDITNCRHPVLKGQVNASSTSFHHMGEFSPDGKTFYASQNNMNVGGFLYIFDVSDPSNVKELPPWQYNGEGRPHSMDINWPGFLPGVPEGNLMFVGQPGNFTSNGANGAGPDALVIEDVSDYQNRKPNPQIRIISELSWNYQGTTESMIPVHINGHPYLITTDEAGGAGAADGWAGACSRGFGAFGYPMIIDVADINKPKIISKLRLEVSDPANCEALRAETPPDTSSMGNAVPGTNLPSCQAGSVQQGPNCLSGTTNYSEESCVPDNPRDTKMLACGFQHAQMRIFDVSNPTHPREIAYWKSGAVRTKVLPAAGSWAAGVDRTVDKIAHWARWVVVDKSKGHGKGRDDDDRNGRGHGDDDDGNGNSKEFQLWVVSDGHGLQVLRFPDSFVARHRDLFENTVTSDTVKSEYSW